MRVGVEGDACLALASPSLGKKCASLSAANLEAKQSCAACSTGPNINVK